MGKLLRMLQYKAVTRVFAEPRMYRAIYAMTLVVFAVCSTSAVFLLEGLRPVLLTLLGGLPCLVAAYQFICIAVGTYIAKSYLTLHPVSVGYSGAYTSDYTGWLAEILDEYEYALVYILQHLMVAITILVMAFDVTVHSFTLVVACCVVVRVVITQCEPWILGKRLQGGVVAYMGQMWRAVYIDVISARVAVCKYANVFGSRITQYAGSISSGIIARFMAQTRRWRDCDT